MSVKVEEYDKVCVIEVDGEFTAENARLAAAAVGQEGDQHRAANIVLDLAKCPFIDSEGLEALLGMKRRCEDMFGQIKLAGLDENVRTIFRITRLEPRFEAHADVSAAIKTLQ